MLAKLDNPTASDLIKTTAHCDGFQIFLSTVEPGILPPPTTTEPPTEVPWWKSDIFYDFIQTTTPIPTTVIIEVTNASESLFPLGVNVTSSFT